MDIIAHRGFTLGPEKARTNHLENAFQLGFGIEFDIRDSKDGIVLAHDPWEKDAKLLNDFLSGVPDKGLLAFNIKSCGLAIHIKNLLDNHQISPSRCFFFDMAIPDQINYLKYHLPVFHRISEFEPLTPLLQKSKGVWLDSFESTWWDAEFVENLLKRDLKVCIVSPELHQRRHQSCWDYMKKHRLHQNSNISLCTDFAVDAKNFFSL